MSLTRTGCVVAAIGFLLIVAASRARADAPATTSPPPLPPPATPGAPAGFMQVPCARPSFAAMFRDEKDGAFDASRWLATRTGFLPLAMPITEPALGLGAAAGAIFFHGRPEDDPKTGRRIPPSATAVVGGATSNGTWAGGVGHLGIWNHDAIRYVGAVGYGEVNLDYYGLSGEFASDPRAFAIEGLFLMQSISFRIGSTDFFVGGRYKFLDLDARFDGGISGLDVDPAALSSQSGGAALTVGYDSRDNIFTPNRGLKAEASLWTHESWLAGDFSFRKAEAYAFAYLPLRRNLILGLRVEGKSVWGDVPFYEHPFVELRGVPIFRYLGEHVLTTEAELRWDVTNRWSVVGFAGAGATSTTIEDLPERFGDLDFRQDVVSGGVGFRYLIARALGLRVGIDLAWSDDEGSLYVTVGSAWLRP